MTQSFISRIAACFLLSAVLLSVLTGCTKRIDTSTEDKYYKTLTEVMDSLPASKHREFDDGMSMIWFYSESDDATNAMLNGKSGKEILAVIEEMKAALPKLDTSSKEAYESSLEKMKAGLPKSKVSTFNDWLKEMPAYRKGNPKIESLNGMTFQKIVENRDFVNSQNPAAQK
ncbi:MAG: hypothetical protein IKC53_00220 [Lentisphaeria bacterium]|nr:hypothetical protein [Lentisphaeria bacterium]